MTSRAGEVYRVLYVAVPFGVVVGTVLALVDTWNVAVLGGWDAVALILLIRIRAVLWNMNAEDTARLARIEDSLRATTDALLVTASVTCILGVGYTLRVAGHSHAMSELALTSIAVASLIFSWLVVHCVYMLRYARLYYTGDQGGIEFNEDDPPQYTDFAYFAFTVGMTFQVSDTNIEEKAIRRNVLHHALLSYLFGAVILAMVVNVGASLLK